MISSNSHSSDFFSFRNRHIGPRSQEVEHMLKTCEADSLDSLLEETIPAKIRLNMAQGEELSLPEALSEEELLKLAKEISSKNRVTRSCIGQGYYGCHTPGVILRNILENPGWYTQYTPYQAEISQGRLEALLNYQTMVLDLTAMDVTNASLLDEGTAAGEAMYMAWNLSQKKKTKKNAKKFYVSKNVFTQTLDVLKTRSAPLDIELVIGEEETPEELEQQNWEEYFGALIQYPDSNGAVHSWKHFSETIHAKEVFLIVAADLLSLTLLSPPGEWGADVVVGTTQRFGVPMGFGGPHAAYFATKEEYKRQVPGRIIGVSIDQAGNPALRMALQTREQHIRREKATSNICTAQVLLAIMAGMYAVYHGAEGLKQIAKKVHSQTNTLANTLKQFGYQLAHDSFFDTLKVKISEDSSKPSVSDIQSRAKENGYNFFYLNNEGNSSIIISLDETTTTNDLESIASIFCTNTTLIDPLENLENFTTAFADELQRTTPFLTHPTFHKYHSETEMLRYIKRLESKDLSLGYSMIPLGSCTMKLNATSEMIPVTWPEFGNMHPFAPADQTQGYQQLFTELENMLSEITGFAATSLQPNAGAQGEFAGLLVIREYHLHHGNPERTTVLIPSSAHGTNPASATLANMNIVIVKCDVHGNIDIEDLREKAEKHKETLSALMVTYPSTHGVFEESIQEVCDIIHELGGLVYLDGANMNAQVGLTHPGKIGADVCHLNLHKTFCIPHGGGGPGVGPICVNEKLAPFLPGHSLASTGGKQAIPAVSSAPWGSAGILVISWAYIRMMGTLGLRSSTEIAILNANYLLTRLREHYPVLYTGEKGRAAHEFILDFRPFKSSAKVEVEDVAKRLMDYGFHAPTVSFPVPGTLMIEPTESESLEELDRFCEALISIRKEIGQIEDGHFPTDNNPLKNAPHTEQVLTADTWDYPYSRQLAAFPTPWLKGNKFWPSVGRIQNAHGDKNLICSCPPVENYALV